MKPIQLLLALLPCAYPMVDFAQCVPANYGAQSNYVLTKTLNRDNVKDECALHPLSLPDVQIGIEYMDGLGRPLQTVGLKASPSGKDFVQPFEYDAAGRQPKVYLPYASATADGAFKSAHATEQAAFYNNAANNNADKVVNDAHPFVRKEFDNSPLDRETRVYPPGAAWQTGTTDRSVKTAWRTNTANEVRNWVIDPATNNANGTAYYPIGRLEVTETQDEDNNMAIEYRDLSGRVVLRKKQNTSTAFLETYYLYDDLGNLRYVVPPAHTSATIAYADPEKDKLVYTYLYDGRQRLTTKKVPGAGAAHFVYDRKNRPVLTQDANQRAGNRWGYTKYDAAGRTVMTGIYTHSAALSQADMQALFNASNPSQIDEKRQNTTTGYSNLVWPMAGCEVLTVDHYDDYDLDLNGTRDYSYVPQGLANEAAVDYSASSLPTYKKVKVLGGTDDWLRTVVFYDAKKRAVQSRKNNHLNLANLSDVETTVYDFSGKPVLTRQVHDRGAGPIAVTKRQEYDHAGRPTKTWHKIGANPEILLSQLKYNEAGQPIEKNLHSENGGTSFLQSLDYGYNIRGFLTEINNPGNIQGSVTNNNGYNNDDNNDLFGLLFRYDAPFAGAQSVPMYNGNISCGIWRSANTAVGTPYRAYAYDYDNAGRLANARYAEMAASTWAQSKKFKEQIAYDANGNIVALNRKDGTGVTIDSLVYGYSGNQVIKVTDRGTAAGYSDGANASTEFTYDANGNLLTLMDRPMSMAYNHLNKPIGISQASPTTVAYTYDALGNKLTKNVSSTNTYLKTHYLGEVEYTESWSKNAPVSFSGYTVQTPEGRIKLEGAVLKYEYDIKDHLGNVRMTFDRDPSTGLARIIQEDHYYPFGMKMGGLSYDNGSGNKKLYNGKELQTEFGMYDYGARMYDPVLGRWNGVDPLAELNRRWSPYVYGYNNPVRFTDPDGMLADDAIAEQNLDWGFSQRIQGPEPGNDNNKPAPTRGDCKCSKVQDGQRVTELGNSSTEIAGNGSSLGYSMSEIGQIDAIQSESSPLDAVPFAKVVGVVGKPIVKALMPEMKLALKGTALARYLGKAGEDAVGITGVKTRIPSLSGTANFRIPDQLTSTTLTEVKNVSQLALTNQIIDFRMYAQQTGRSFIIYTRPTTTFTNPLQTLINQGNIIIKPIP